VWRKDSDDWVSASRSFEVNGVRDRGSGRKTWDECVNKDLVELQIGFRLSYVAGSRM